MDLGKYHYNNNNQKELSKEPIAEYLLSRKFRNTIHSKFSSLKNYIYVLVLLPTAIGIIWQFFALLEVGINYLRFFSFKQLVSDGLTLMPVIFLVTLWTYFIYRGAFKFVQSFKNEFKPKDKIHWFTIIVYLVSTLFIISISIITFLDIVFDVETILNDYILGVFILIPPMLIFQTTFTFFITETKSIKVRLSNFMKESAVMLIVFTFVAFIALSVKLLSQLSSYNIPKNLKNLEVLNEYLEKEHKLNPNQYEVTYMNDAYIFIKTPVLSPEEIDKLLADNQEIPKEEVLILKTDKLFD